jgi:hypothetical protein
MQLDDNGKILILIRYCKYRIDKTLELDYVKCTYAYQSVP